MGRGRSPKPRIPQERGVQCVQKMPSSGAPKVGESLGQDTEIAPEIRFMTGIS